ncbi:MAG: aldo/keto reductase [Actinomycetota bacterium]|nr:aldo/keto reductase [Actinomycetota bacterium]MDA2998025.1 aldo/keto reductase [Actinomycetota bacterium]MDA3035907.1 aldo/keto reductase [Actinomycetota bacterium]
MARHSELVKIPRIDQYVTKLALGSAPLGGLFTEVTDAEAEATILAAVNSGINFFDTAPLYGHGNAEKRVGAALNKANKPFVISTKVGRVLQKFTPEEISGKVAGLAGYIGVDPTIFPVFDFSKEGIVRSLEESLTRLNLASVDIALIHDADDQIDKAIAESYPVLDELRSKGVIKGIGVGLNYCSYATKAVKEMDLDIILIAGRYSLLDQSAQEELFKECMKKNTGVMVGGVYNSGVLANPTLESTYDYVKVTPEILKRALDIKQLLADFHVPLTAAAIQFPLRHPAVTCVVTGSRSVKELISNISDFDMDIPEAAWNALEESGLVNRIEI